LETKTPTQLHQYISMDIKVRKKLGAVLQSCLTAKTTPVYLSIHPLQCMMWSRW